MTEIFVFTTYMFLNYGMGYFSSTLFCVSTLTNSKL